MKRTVIPEIDLPPPSSFYLQKELRMQLDFIENSCVIYDQGHSEEALRIAPAVAAILYPDIRLRYHCLAKKLLEKHWPFLELFSTYNRPSNLSQAQQDKSAFLLLLNRLVDNCCLPVLTNQESSSNRGEMHYLRWLDQPIICFHYQKKFYSYTREQVIRLVCGKLMSTLLPHYLKEDIFLQHPDAPVIQTGQCHIALMDIFTASLRQIGYELLNSPALRKLTETTVVIH